MGYGMWLNMNPNCWPELRQIREAVARQHQVPTQECAVTYIKKYKAALVVREWPDGSLTANLTKDV